MRVVQFMNKEKGWHLCNTSNPLGTHFAITAGNLKAVNDSFCKDLRDACDYVKIHQFI